jgi:selenocysteine lyase/cysteine desulfurase
MRTPRRDDFELPANEVYLNGAYLTPFLRASRAAVEQAWNMKARPYETPATSQRELPDLVREPLGRVLGVPGEDVGITTSSHYGALLLAQGIRWRDGDRVLIGPDEYPTNVYPWLALEERGVRVERVGTPGQSLTTAQLRDAIARGGRVRVLAIAATHYVTGNLHPLAALAELIHAQGGVLVVDGAQAVGAVDLAWGDTGADAILMSGYKWLLGPFGIGAVWVRPELRDQLMDVNANWLALDSATDFDRVMREYPRTFGAHGRRFDVGQAGSHFNVLLLRTGLDYVLEVGVAQIEAHHRAMQDALVDAIDGLPLAVVTRLDDVHRGPLLLVEPSEPEIDVRRLWEGLRDRHVHVSLRGGRLRIAPGVWNEPADALAFAAAAAELLPTPRRA